MTDEEAEVLLKQLKEHYHQPVMPISKYCKALTTWTTCLQDRVDREKEKAFPGISGPLSHPDTVKAYEAYNEARKSKDVKYNDLWSAMGAASDVDFTFLQIRKSALLDRLLYVGEALRTEMCPKHKGTWSGVAWSENEGCEHGCGLTGWLPKKKNDGQ